MGIRDHWGYHWRVLESRTQSSRRTYTLLLTECVHADEEDFFFQGVSSEISVHDIILCSFSRHSNTCPPFLTRIRRSRKLNYLAMHSSSGVTSWCFTWHVQICKAFCHWTKISTSSFSSSPPSQSSSFSIPASTPCNLISVHLDWQFCVLNYSHYLLCIHFPYISVLWVLVLCIYCEQLLRRILI